MNPQYQTATPLPDLQKTPDTLGMGINLVGICDISFPIVIPDQQNQKQQASARLTMSVSLPHHFKGTPMNRFQEILIRHQGKITMQGNLQILHVLKRRLDAESAHIEVEFPNYILRTAPVSGLSAPLEYRSTFIAESNDVTDDLLLHVVVPVPTQANDNPVFVEGAAHTAAGFLKQDPRITWFEFHAVNHESILNHPTFAFVNRRCHDSLPPSWRVEIARQSRRSRRSCQPLTYLEFCGMDGGNTYDRLAFTAATGGFDERKYHR